MPDLINYELDPRSVDPLRRWHAWLFMQCMCISAIYGTIRLSSSLPPEDRWYTLSQ